MQLLKVLVLAPTALLFLALWLGGGETETTILSWLMPDESGTSLMVNLAYMAAALVLCTAVIRMLKPTEGGMTSIEITAGE